MSKRLYFGVLVVLGLVVPMITAQPTPPILTIDLTAPTRLISPYIYGINFASEAFANEIDLPINRWGGNSTTRYNWQTDTANHAMDWYFENIQKDNPNRPNLPHGSESDRFVEQNIRTGTQTLLTIPMIGWTPRPDQNTRIMCGFSVAKYGAQQSTDPWQSDCGNGIYPNGTRITGNDPLDTSVAITPQFVTQWMTHLNKYGTAASGGVRFYNLDNEPSLWNDTHRDVYPNPLSYDQLRDRTYQYARAIKDADPNAQTLGPVEYGWTAYFYSALDWHAGGSWWENPIDRNAHGGIPLVPWYLQQMQTYQNTHGIRILDYLDLHYYPSQPGVALQPAGDAATQALRLRATRSLWDPTYIDESWIGTDVGEAVRLIPRMREWVNANYAGTKLAISEYNFGGLEHINGALTQADVLGIFGREGLDLATIWALPETNGPGHFAFRMYRNYDGAGAKFGDLGVAAASSNQGQLSIYAARRNTDNRLTVIVINKTQSSLTSPVNITGLTAAAIAKVYRYSAVNLNAIQSLPDQSVSISGFTATFPAASMTVFEIPLNTPTPNGVEMLRNISFEDDLNPADGLADFWGIRNGTGEQRVCTGVIARTGNCVFQFNGAGASEDSILQQRADLSVGTLDLGDTLTFRGYATATGAPNFRIRIIVNYQNGTLQRVQARFNTPSSSYVALLDPLTGQPLSVTLNGQNVIQVRVVLWSRNTTGQTDFDDLSLQLTEPSAAALIPMP
ncbi:MAG: glycoside hydrolase family 44 protein [Anaerolineae bacterium]|nr:glycoside hydrolase family 44 protein [Anaerolineae bacterium]